MSIHTSQSQIRRDERGRFLKVGPMTEAEVLALRARIEERNMTSRERLDRARKLSGEEIVERAFEPLSEAIRASPAPCRAKGCGSISETPEGYCSRCWEEVPALLGNLGGCTIGPDDYKGAVRPFWQRALLWLVGGFIGGLLAFDLIRIGAGR